MRSNQIRLYCSSIAYCPMQALRRLGLAGAEMAKAPPDDPVAVAEDRRAGAHHGAQDLDLTGGRPLRRRPVSTGLSQPHRRCCATPLRLNSIHEKMEEVIAKLAKRPLAVARGSVTCLESTARFRTATGRERLPRILQLPLKSYFFRPDFRPHKAPRAQFRAKKPPPPPCPAQSRHGTQAEAVHNASPTRPTPPENKTPASSASFRSPKQLR